MKEVAGWWVPDIMSGPGSYLRRSQELLAHMQLTRGREVAIQAGGHIGTYPTLLAAHFAHVYTFEPEAENFSCLTRNCTQPNVFAARGCLGEKRRTVGLSISLKSTGKHQVRGAGAVPTYRIDDLGVTACDLLALDLEGYELAALAGATETIRRFEPVIVAEENGRQLRFGVREGELARFLAPQGYRVVQRVGEDLVLTT